MRTFGPHLDGYHDVANQMIQHLRDRGARQIAERVRLKDGLKNVREFEAYRRGVREHFLQAIGGLPVPEGEPRPPLRARVTGTLDRGGYRIEKLLYQSVPDFYVTANVYVPKSLSGPAPAVLFVCGHSENAKAYDKYQAVCIDLVNNGFVVLGMDPPGQGERFQYWDPVQKKRVIGASTTEHTYAGLQYQLQGATIARQFVWDGMRGIDYLCSRPEVDAARIGVTGNSGGGLQTCFLMLAEPRVAAAVPCTFVMSLETYLQTGQPQDAEQIVPGCFPHGPDHDDFLTAMAPKPVLVGTVEYDFFPTEGTLEAIERAKRIFRLYGAEEKLQMASAPTRHEYAPGLREAAVNWFRRHLAGKPADFRTGEPAILPDEQLWVTPGGQVLDALPESKTLFHLGRERLAARLPRTSRDAGELRRGVREALRIDLNGREAAIHPRIIREETVDGWRVEKLFFFSEPRVCVSAVMVHPKETRPDTETVMLLLENGTNDIPAERPRLEALLREGRRVFVFDVRGVGGVESRPLSGAAPHNREYRLGCDAMMMGTSTLGLRVYDALRGSDYLTRNRKDVDPKRIRLHGVDSGAAWAWLAAVLEPGFAGLTVENGLASFRELGGARFYDSARWGLKNLAYGLAAHFDLPDLLPALAPRPVTVVSPRKADGSPMPATEYRQHVLAGVRLPEGWEVELR